MSKDQKSIKKLNVENVEKLKVSCKMINEIVSGCHYWKVEQIWPVNLYVQGLQKIVEMLNQIIFNEDTNNEVLHR